MKKLFLYFLFFVGAAFIFIQCARLFPSKRKSNRFPVSERFKEQPQRNNSSAIIPVRSVAISEEAGSFLLNRNYLLYAWAGPNGYTPKSYAIGKDAWVQKSKIMWSTRNFQFDKRFFSFRNNDEIDIDLFNFDLGHADLPAGKSF